MRAVHYNLMRHVAFAVLTVAIVVLETASSLAQQATLKTASLDSHEGLTISALPWTDPAKYKEKFPKKSPYSAGVLAVQVAFRNDSDDSMRVTLSRVRLTVRLDSDNTQELPSLTPEEFAQAVLKPATKDPTARRRIPLPMPVPSGGKDNKVSDLQRQASDAAVPTGVIAPHSTVQGLLYFDLQNQFDLLETAHLYVPEIVLMRGNRALTYFDIDLSRRSAP